MLRDDVCTLNCQTAVSNKTCTQKVHYLFVCLSSFLCWSGWCDLEWRFSVTKFFYVSKITGLKTEGQRGWSKPGQGDLEYLVSGHEGRQSRQGLFARASNSNQQSIASRSPNHTKDLYNHQLDGCIVWHAHNTVFGSKRSAIRAQAVYFLHSTRPSVTWLNSRWWLAACD